MSFQCDRRPSSVSPWRHVRRRKTFPAAVIPEAQPALSEVLLYTSKVTQLIRISRKQYEQPSTPDHLAQSVSRAIVRRAELAFVSETVADRRQGRTRRRLLNMTGIVEGGVVSDSLDVLIDLVATLQANLATPSHVLVGPNGWA
jgi:hypothetical protein